jgi:hypothetical protein
MQVINQNVELFERGRERIVGSANSTSGVLDLVLLIILVAAQAFVAQEKRKVFFSDDFRLESTPPAYLWYYDQKGILEKVQEVDGGIVDLVKDFAENCDCTVLREPDDANYVILVSRYDFIFRPKLAEKKFVVMKVDGEKLVLKGSVRRASSIASDSCKAITQDWKTH